MQRVTVVARRVVRDRKRFAPLAAVAALGMLLGFFRAVSPSSKEPLMASQTFLTAPGRGTEPSVSDILDRAPSAEAVTGDTSAPVGAGAITPVPEMSATAVAERQAHPAPRVVPRRPAPPARPKAPASSTAANEPDVGF